MLTTLTLATSPPYHRHLTPGTSGRLTTFPQFATFEKLSTVLLSTVVVGPCRVTLTLKPPRLQQLLVEGEERCREGREEKAAMLATILNTLVKDLEETKSAYDKMFERLVRWDVMEVHNYR